MRSGKELSADDVHQLAEKGLSGTASPLPYLDQIQRSFGSHDVSGIEAYIGGPASQASQGMGAEAYAAGNRVAFRQTPDLHTAAHEAAHVVQQRAGVHLAKGVGKVGDEYEQNADAVADAVVAGRSAEALLAGAAPAPAPASALQRQPIENPGQGNAPTGEHGSDAPVEEHDGSSPQARAILQRLGLRPQLPPDAMAKLSRGLEKIAEQAAILPVGAPVGEELSFHVVEGDWQLALRIGVDPQTGSVHIDLAFEDGEATKFMGSFRTTPPRAMNAVTPIQPANLEREIAEPELTGVESPLGLTPLDVARFLFAESTEVQLAEPGEDGVASASPPSESAKQSQLEAELERTEAEIAAAEQELLWLMADTAIDLAGIVDPTPISDGIAMVRDLSRGDYFGAVLSGISIIPWLGDALAKPIKGARILDKANDARRLLAKLQKRASKLRKRLKKPDKVPISSTSKIPEAPSIEAPKLGDGTLPATSGSKIESKSPTSPNATSPGPGSPKLRPEGKYLKGKKHGIEWTEGPAEARKTGKPQGQWGSRADLDFAGERAGSLAPGEGAYFTLPPGNSSVVHLPDGSTVPATRIWVRNNGSGTFHGYPSL